MKKIDYVLSPHTFARAEQCPRARVYRGPKSGPSHAAWHGIAIHLFIQYALTRGRDYALGYIKQKFPRKLAFCEGIDLASFPEGDAEVQYLIDTKRQDAIEVSAQDMRSEADHREHISVKTDLVARDEPWVIDYKTGTAVIDPATSHQSLIEALALWLYRGKKPGGVRASIFTIAKGVIVQAHHDFTDDELAAGLRRVRRVHLEVLETRAEHREEGIEPEAVPGRACARCDMLPVCDEGTEYVGKDTEDDG